MLKYDNPDLSQTLLAGGIAVMPVDTVYGIVTPALNPAAVERLYRVRQRPLNQPSIILIDSVERLQEFDIVPTSQQLAVLADVWPGAVTVIMDGRPERLVYLNPDGHDLAVRIPGLSPLRELIAITGPLLAPSANLPGQPTATTIQEAQGYFGDLVDMYADGGPIEGSASKIIRLDSAGEVRVIRS